MTGTPGSAPVQRLPRRARRRRGAPASATQLRVDEPAALPATGSPSSTVDTLGVASDPLSGDADTAAPEPTSGSAHAFLLATTDASFEDFQAHYRPSARCTRPTSTARHATRRRSWAATTRRSRSFVRTRATSSVMPRYNCQSPATPARRSSPTRATRRAVSTALVALCAALRLRRDQPRLRGRRRRRPRGADRVRRRAGRRSARDQAGACRSTSRRRSRPANHPRSTLLRLRRRSPQNADTVLVMAWGLHWTTSAPGPSTSSPWLTDVAAYVPPSRTRSRFVLGTALYGLDWPAGGGPAHPRRRAGLRRRPGPDRGGRRTPVRDPVYAARCTSPTPTPPAARTTSGTATRRPSTSPSSWPADYGLGFGFWRVGQRGPRRLAEPGLR